MIVTDDNVSDALAYLSMSPHPVALARYELAKAEGKSKRLWAMAFVGATGTVKERECEAEISQDYLDAKEAEAECILAVERHKERVKAAENIIEVWRSENANARAAERVR